MALEIVQALIRLADRDMEALIKPIAAESGDMELESAAIRPEGIVVKGRYSMGFMKVGVELVLTPRAENGKVLIALSAVRMLGGAGLPGMARDLILDMMSEQVRSLPGMSVEGETIAFDLEAAGREHGLEVAAKLTSIDLKPGQMEVAFG
ncbi:MAG: hypothetical protein ACKO26_18865 [Planctomycetota bacterium]